MFISSDSGQAVVDDQLASLVTQIEQPFTAGEFDTAVELLEAHTLVAWFGFNPARLAEILRSLVARQGTSASSIYALHVFLSSADERKFVDPAVRQRLHIEGDKQTRLLLDMLAMFEERLQGHPVRALEAASTLNDRADTLRPLFDTDSSWRLLAAVQTGLTAMLAGDLREALNQFTQAKLAPTSPSLMFLRRDALLKAALIHACFGDAGRARSLLDLSLSVPRTSSWVEPHIDAVGGLGESMLLGEEPQAALDRFNQVDLQAVGELWPYFVIVLQRVYESSGLGRDLTGRMEMLDALPFARTDGEGLPGSVMNVTFAWLQASHGNMSQALLIAERADDSIAPAALFKALLLVQTGRPQAAIDIATRMRTAVRGLRQLEMLRFSVLAAAYLALDQPDPAQEILRMALDYGGELGTNEARMFIEEAQEFARERFAEWPAATPVMAPRFRPQRLGVSLTKHEASILNYLSKGVPDTLIAQEMFIPISTYNSQLESLLAKFKVSS